jgi:hypothetical protein
LRPINLFFRQYLDSNVIIYLINGTLNSTNSQPIVEAAKQPAFVSVISKIEILSWNPPTQAAADEYQNFMDDAIVLELWFLDKSCDFAVGICHWHPYGAFGNSQAKKKTNAFSGRFWFPFQPDHEICLRRRTIKCHC